MSGDLSRYIQKPALVDISENDDQSVSVDIRGYQVVGIIAPAALTGTPTIDGFLIDPGDGTLRQVVDTAGTPITNTGAIAADELQALPTNPPLIGNAFAFDLSVAQLADRTFILVLRRIDA